MGIGLIITTYTMKEPPMQKILKETVDLKKHNLNYEFKDVSSLYLEEYTKIELEY